jgi:hypothetical protein
MLGLPRLLFFPLTHATVSMAGNVIFVRCTLALGRCFRRFHTIRSPGRKIVLCEFSRCARDFDFDRDAGSGSGFLVATAKLGPTSRL